MAAWSWAIDSVPRMRALRVHLERVDRLAASHEHEVMLRTAEAEIRDYLWCSDAPDEFPARIEHQHTRVTKRRIRAGPYVAVHVDRHVVGSAPHPVDLHVGKEAFVGNGLAIARDGKCVDLSI